MKTKILTIILILFSSYLFSQHSILLYTNFPSSIKIFENNKIINKTAIWEENAGGYIVDLYDATKTIISARDKISFKISNDNKLTKNINLNKGDKLSIYKCLNSEEYCCEQLTAKQQSATKKIYAISLMKKSALRNKTVIFKNLTNEFIDKKKLLISWETDSLIKSISIYDVNSMEIIYEKKYSENVYSIDYNTIKNELKQDLKPNNKYVLKIITRNLENPITETEESSFEFNIKKLAFKNKQYYYYTYESVNIEWQSKLNIKKLYLKDKQNGEVISEMKNFTNNSFILSENLDKTKIKYGKDYLLEFILADETVIKYPFVILLDNEEDKGLKSLLD